MANQSASKSTAVLDPTIQPTPPTQQEAPPTQQKADIAPPHQELATISIKTDPNALNAGGTYKIVKQSQEDNGTLGKECVVKDDGSTKLSIKCLTDPVQELTVSGRSTKGVRAKSGDCNTQFELQSDGNAMLVMDNMDGTTRTTYLHKENSHREDTAVINKFHGNIGPNQLLRLNNKELLFLLVLLYIVFIAKN